MTKTEERGIYTKTGVPVLITPTPEQIVRINGLSNAYYFSTIGDGPLYTPYEIDESSGGLNRVDSPYFLHFSINPLSSRIRGDLRQLLGRNTPKEIGIRGTACSLKGTIEYQDILGDFHLNSNRRIRSLEQILEEGTDTGIRTTNVVIVSLGSEGFLTGYPSAYSHFYPRKFRASREFFGLDSSGIFPLVLVYDLGFAIGRGSQIKLPENHPGKAILSAYVLDYPNR